MRHFGVYIKHFRVKLAEGLIGDYNFWHKYSLPYKVQEIGCKRLHFQGQGSLQELLQVFKWQLTTTIVDMIQLCIAKSVAMLSVLCLGRTMMDQNASKSITASTYTKDVIN